MLQRILLIALILAGTSLGALMTGFSGDSGPGLVFYFLSVSTLAFFLSGLVLVLLPSPVRGTLLGRGARAVFVGVIGLVILAWLLLLLLQGTGLLR